MSTLHTITSTLPLPLPAIPAPGTERLIRRVSAENRNPAFLLPCAKGSSPLSGWRQLSRNHRLARRQRPACPDIPRSCGQYRQRLSSRTQWRVARYEAQNGGTLRRSKPNRLSIEHLHCPHSSASHLLLSWPRGTSSARA